MFNRILKFNALFLLVFSFLFYSCEKDTITSSENLVDENEELLAFHGFSGPHGPEGPRHRFLNRCFDLVYPITLEYPDGTTAEAESVEALRDILMDWRQNNPDATEGPNLVFPVDVSLRNDTVVTIDGPEGLRTLAARCHQIQHIRRCFDIVYPISISLPDGTITEVADGEALHDLISQWRENNPDATDHPGFVFPIEVELRNGNVISIDNQEELRRLRRRCSRTGNDERPDPDMGERCIQLVFPLSVSFPDGTSAEAENRQQLHRLIRQWRANNQDAEERPTIAFPHDVTLEDGTVVTVNNQEEVQALLDDCTP